MDAAPDDVPTSREPAEVRTEKDQELALLPPEATQRHLRELQVRHAQLEMQYEELRRMLGQRERSETAYLDWFHHAPCGYRSLDTDGNFIMVNQTELEWLGSEREELIGHPISAGRWSSGAWRR